MLIEFHMLKNYPPVNLNRDDTGAPKNCFFGRVQRGRISSQCLKRSWRLSDSIRALGSFGSRTRRMRWFLKCSPVMLSTRTSDTISGSSDMPRRASVHLLLNVPSAARMRDGLIAPLPPPFPVTGLPPSMPDG